MPAQNKAPVVGTKFNTLDAEVPVDVTPSFRWSKFEHAANPLLEAGMWDNTCWPKQKASKDPGFPLWPWDEWYNTHPLPNPRPYDYKKEYKQGSNGD